MNLQDVIKTSKVKKLLFIPANMDQREIGGGIYRMYDKTGKVVYVGKSKNLHRRLLQHIGKDTHTAYFIEEIDYIEWLKENDPVYQTLLEAIFIAYHEPKYNDEVKDKRRAQNELL